MLEAYLQEPNLEVAAAAAVALGMIGNHAAIVSLSRALKDAPERVRPACAEGCVLAAERMLKEGQSAEAAKLYDQVCQSDVPLQIIRESTRGAILSRGPKGIPLLIELLNSPDKNLFQLGLTIIREFQGSEVDEALATELTQFNPARTALIIQAMADRSETVVLSSILESATHGPKEATIAAVDALGRVGDASCLAVLLDLALQDDSEVAQEAKETLFQIPDEHINAEILAMLPDAQEGKLLLLLEVVGRRRIDAVAFLIKSLNHPDSMVRSAALFALGETANFSNFPILLSKFIESTSHEDESQTKQALKAASVRLPNREECSAVLIEALEQSSSVTKKIGLLEILGAVGGERALASMDAAAKGSESQLVDTSSRLLGEWMTEDAAHLLLDLSKNASEEKYQIRALRGYIRIAKQFNLPEQERIEMCRRAFEAAHRSAEQELVLDVLKIYPSAESLKLARQAMNIPELKNKATDVINSINQKLAKDEADQSKLRSRLNSLSSKSRLVNSTIRIPTFRKIQLSDKFFCEGATCADINGDGHTDFIAGPFWFAGPTFAEPHTYRSAELFEIDSYSNDFFTFAYDCNQDGRVDILVVPAPGENAFWFENPGSTEGNWPQHMYFEAVDNESPAFVDLTGDSRPELLCISKGQYGFVEIPSEPAKATWPFRSISPGLGYGKYTHGLGYGDLNNDGRLDVLEKNGWWEQPEDITGEELWKFRPVPFSEAGGAQMHPADLDGDGDQDVVTSKGAHDYGLSWFEQVNETDGKEFHEHRIMEEHPSENAEELSFSQLHAVDLADINQDGVPDIVTGKRYWAHGGKDPGANEPAVLYWFETVRTKEGVEFHPHLIDRNSGVGTQVEARDINGDSLVDILVGNKKGLFLFLQNK